MYYILDGKEVKKVESVIEWADCFESLNRIVKRTTIGNISISTVFLGIDHNFFGKGEPLLFETMVFGENCNDFMDRYSTWEEAESGHDNICKMIILKEQNNEK